MGYVVMQGANMIPNLYPADEIAQIRAEIRRLEAREQELRAGFLAGKLPLVGYESRVEVRKAKRRVFLRDKLSAQVLSDPKLWEERLALTVIVVTRASTLADRHSIQPPRGSLTGAGRGLR